MLDLVACIERADEIDLAVDRREWTCVLRAKLEPDHASHLEFKKRPQSTESHAENHLQFIKGSGWLMDSFDCAVVARFEP